MRNASYCVALLRLRIHLYGHINEGIEKVHYQKHLLKKKAATELHFEIYIQLVSGFQSNIQNLTQVFKGEPLVTYDAFLTSVPKSRTACFWGLFHYPNYSN